MKTAKYLAIALLLGFSSTVSAGGCEEVINEETGETECVCSPAGPFDVVRAVFDTTATDYDHLPREFPRPWDCHTWEGCFDVNAPGWFREDDDSYKVQMSPRLLALIQGMARYAEEYEQWADANEWYMDYLYAEQKNANRTDNIAWGIVVPRVRITFTFEGGDPITLRGGDIIHGSDWNNNGQIDTLEYVSGVTYNTSAIDFYSPSPPPPPPPPPPPGPNPGDRCNPICP